MLRASTIAAFAAIATLPAAAELVITEICPKPGKFDANGRESGWVELYNAGDETVDLKDYELVRKNIGKALSPGKKKKNLLSRKVEPGKYTLVYTSDEYPNSEDMAGSEVVEEYNGLMVYPSKVNPKKFPVVALYKGKDADTKELLQIEYIPVDLQEGWSYCGRTIMQSPTPGADNDYSGAIDYGPNIGPLPCLKHSVSVFDPPARPVAGKDYQVTIPVNPLPCPGFATNAILSVTLCYHSGFDTANEKKLVMEKSSFDKKGAGQKWTATIPADDVPSPGQMLRWRAVIEEDAGDGKTRTWNSPSFLNPDDGFQYLGTVVESPDLEDAKLQTFHLFADGNNLTQMDVDVDRQDTKLVPCKARCEVFDAQTGHFYDNVRIDLRGNTSGTFRKKSHAFKFAKCHPLECTNPFDGEKISTRKTSFIAEYCDPAYIRQSLAFWTFRQAGCPVPFDYPVRVNLNGEFYQLAFHSDRFTDKLIEDHYELNKVYDAAGDIKAGWLVGYGYKNSGCLHWDGSRLVNWVACEKKTPDDGNEGDLSVLTDWVKYFNDGMAAATDDQPAITKKVVETFDLPAWLNYLAEARITMECDDTWANLSTYYDAYGTGTWMPLGYDMNQSWGHIYYTQYGGDKGITYADKDAYKAHPLFGGRRVICHFANGGVSHSGSENWACEAIWQSTKFRRMYLRRLRTLMDTQLMPPGTAKEATPFWRDYVTAVTNAIWECAKLDYARWRVKGAAGSGTFWTETGTYCWPDALSHSEGIDDLWTNYVEPRRKHLFVTHSVTNTAWAVGYAQDLNAGIPLSQSPIAKLSPGFSFAETGEDGVLAIVNANAEAVDMSGWRLRGRVDWTLPPGTVVDANDTVIVVEDRAAYVKAHFDELTDETIVGNAFFNNDIAGIRLETAAGEEVANTLSAEILSVSEDVQHGRATVTVDVSEVAAAYGVSDYSAVSVTVTPAGGVPASASVGADGRATVTWQNPRKGVVREIEIAVEISGSGTAATLGDVVIVSAWQWFFRATEAEGGTWSVAGGTTISQGTDGVTVQSPDGADSDAAFARFSLSEPGKSGGKVVVLELECAWNVVDSRSLDADTSAMTGLARTEDGFVVLADGDWQALEGETPPDARIDAAAAALRTIAVLDFAAGTATYYLLDSTDAWRIGSHAISPAFANGLKAIDLFGNATIRRLDGKLLARNGTEPTGFFIRIR